MDVFRQMCIILSVFMLHFVDFFVYSTSTLNYIFNDYLSFVELKRYAFSDKRLERYLD